MPAWPPVPTGGSAFIKHTSTSTVVFGTDGLMNTYIVKSAKFAQRSEEIDIENGTGFEVVVYLLNKGEHVEFTVVEDSSGSLTKPVIGTVMTFYTPFTPAGLPFLVTDPSVNTARKEPGERVISAKSYTLINLAT